MSWTVKRGHCGERVMMMFHLAHTEGRLFFNSLKKIQEHAFNLYLGDLIRSRSVLVFSFIIHDSERMVTH